MASEDILELYDVNSKYRLPLDLIKMVAFYLPVRYLFQIFAEHIPFAGYQSNTNISVDEYFYQEYFLARLPNANIRMLANIKLLNLSLMSKIGLKTRWSGSVMEFNPLSEKVDTTQVYLALPNHLDCKVILPKYKLHVVHEDETDDVLDIYEDLNRHIPHNEKLVYATNIKDCFAKHVMGIDTCSWSQFLEHLYVLFGPFNEFTTLLDQVEKQLEFGKMFDDSDVMNYINELITSDAYARMNVRECYENISDNIDHYRSMIIRHIVNPDVLAMKYHSVTTIYRKLSYFLILGIIDDRLIQALVRMIYFHYHIEKNFNINSKIMDILLY